MNQSSWEKHTMHNDVHMINFNLSKCSDIVSFTEIHALINMLEGGTYPD